MKKLITLMLGAFVTTSSAMAAEDVLMPIENLPGCQIYHSYNEELDEKASWSGECKDGLAEGQGTAEFWYYKGNRPAMGRHTIKGQFLKGRLTGEYQLTFYGENGVLAEEYGTYVNDKLEGARVVQYTNGTTLDRNYENGEQVGPDLLQYPDGTLYRGKRDKKGFQGSVAIAFVKKDGAEDGILFIEFKDNVPFEEGEYKLPSGEIVKGVFDFETRSVNGDGEIIRPGGGTYVGLIKNNKPNGRGIYEDDQFRITAVFKGSLNTGEGEIKSKTGPIKYTGEFRDGEPNGEGAFLVRPGLLKKGTFVDGELQGRGRILLDGMILSGKFEHGEPTGNFRLPLPEGGECSIELDNDYMPIGRGTWVFKGKENGICHYNGNRMVLNKN